jgi:hypothetical protein
MGRTTIFPSRIEEGTQLDLDSKVMVELTPLGFEILVIWVRETNSGNSSDVDDDIASSIDTRYRLGGDEYVFSLYEFMSIFGPHLPLVAVPDPVLQLFAGAISLLPTED